MESAPRCNRSVPQCVSSAPQWGALARASPALTPPYRPLRARQHQLLGCRFSRRRLTHADALDHRLELFLAIVAHIRAIFNASPRSGEVRRTLLRLADRCAKRCGRILN